MSTARATTTPVRHADRFFIGGEWVEPTSDATVATVYRFSGSKSCRRGGLDEFDPRRHGEEFHSLVLRGEFHGSTAHAAVAAIYRGIELCGLYVSHNTLLSLFHCL